MNTLRPASLYTLYVYIYTSGAGESKDEDESKAPDVAMTVDTGHTGAGAMLTTSTESQGTDAEMGAPEPAEDDREQQEQRQQLLFGSSGAHGGGRRGVKSKMMKGITRLVGGLKKR